MSDVMVLGGTQNPVIWGSPLFERGFGQEPRAVKPQAAQAPQAPQAGNAWLSAEDVARLLLTGEFLDAGVSVPASFAPQAMASAISSVERWTREGRIFAIHDLYPRYQFDRRGRPHPPIERAIALLGTQGVLRVGNWFATPNGLLQGRRPQELLAAAPADVLRALERA
jgi:hypothetical protein